MGNGWQKLQSFLDHTISRLLTNFKERMKTLQEEERSSLMQVGIWWHTTTAIQAKVAVWFLFRCHQSSSVSLRLIYFNNNRILWQNPTFSSLRYCRLIRVKFMEETSDVTKEEITYIQNAIKELQNTEVKIEAKSFMKSYSMIMIPTTINWWKNIQYWLVCQFFMPAYAFLNQYCI